ncbi:hypothetical protein [Halomonas salipaludis]|uniref:hypothetical protein n=1 Tax=Halomonas salipaludis TaxID=2032625 RepID=UPI001140EC27|nr:hypothetical protein [Halomonas salipaludis]
MNYSACFLISAPLHLLNAIEARRTLLSDSCTTLLIVLDKGNGFGDVLGLAAEFVGDVFDECVHVSLMKPDAGYQPIHAIQSLIYNKRVIKNEVVPKCESAGKVFIGNILNQEMLAAAHSSAERVTILDDGTSTLSYLEARKRKGRHNWLGIEYPGSRLGCFLKILVARLFYGDIDSVRFNPSFFTLYNDEAIAIGCESTENHYDYIKSIMVDAVVEPRFDFLGAPFVDRGELVWEDYREWLAIVQKNSEHPIRYIAHWSESDESLKLIKDEFDIECIRLDYPYELEYVLSKNKASLIGGWFSSAFDVLDRIKQDSTVLVCFKPPENALSSMSIKSSESSFFSRHEKGSNVNIMHLADHVENRNVV